MYNNESDNYEELKNLNVNLEKDNSEKIKAIKYTNINLLKENK